MRASTLLLAFLSCTLLWNLSAKAQKITLITSDSNGQLTLTQPTVAGTLRLQPGIYAVKYHTSHEQHFIRFLRVTQEQKLSQTRSYTGWYTATELIKAGEARCRVQPLPAKVHATAVKIATDGTARITEVMIKGKREACEL